MKWNTRSVVICFFIFLVTSTSTSLILKVAKPHLRDFFAVRPQFQDIVESIELEMDLRHPPKFIGNAVLRLRKGAQEIFPFVLNQKLQVNEITDASGQELKFKELGRLRSPYFKESRALEVRLPANTQEIRIRYSGQGYDGSEEKDWMGILLLASDELRMSMQTVFYPQVPIDLEGPSPMSWPGKIHATVSEKFEAHAPGNAIAPKKAPAGSRAWSWESESPTVFSFFAAERVRQETRLGQASVLTLLTPEHAKQGEAIAAQAEKNLAYYTKTWGDIGKSSLGIVEMMGRGNSYNWASPGIVAMEHGALANNVALEALAHEISHLWWGNPRGPAERFLTEGLAEYGSWRFVQESSGESAAQTLALEAEQRWWQSVHESGEDPSVLDFGFHTKGYDALAYAKGPVFLWRCQQWLGVSKMDQALRSYGKRLREKPAAPDSSKLLLETLREAAADSTGVNLSLFEQSGHFHLALEQLSFETNKVSGNIFSRPCPRAIPAPTVEKISLQIFTESNNFVREIDMEQGGKTRFEIECPSEPLAVRADPDGFLPRHDSLTAVRPGLGFLQSDPPEGARALPLGPLTFRLHFGSTIQIPEDSFSKAIEAQSYATAREAKTPGISILSLKMQEDSHTLLVEIEGTMPEREHILAIPEGLMTAHGIPLPEFSVRFGTKSAYGVARPRIVATEPASGAQAVPPSLSQVKIVFSEPMQIGRGFRTRWIQELQNKGWTYPSFAESSWEDSRTLVWKLSEPLQRGTRYGIPFDELYISKLGLRLDRFDLLFETEP